MKINRLFLNIFAFSLSMLILPQALFAQNNAPSQEEIDDLNRQAANLNQEVQDMQKDFDGLQQAFVKMENEMRHADTGWFADFRSKLLVKTPTFLTLNTNRHDRHFAFGIYGQDVCKALFALMYVYIEYCFYMNMKEVYQKNLSAKLIHHKRDIIFYLSQEDKETAIAREFDDFFDAECFSSFAYSANLKIPAKYLLQKHVYQYFHENTFVKKDGASKSDLFKFIDFMNDLEQKLNDNHEIVISAATVTTPLLKGMFMGPSWSRDLAGNLPAIRSFLFRITGCEAFVKSSMGSITGWSSKTIDSSYAYTAYTLDLTKQTFIFSRFLKQAHAQHRQCYKEYIKNHSSPLLSILKKVPDSFLKRDEVLVKIQEDLREFFNKNTEDSFLSWVAFKESCCNWTEIWIELGLMMPAIVKAGFFGYEYYTQKT